MHAFIIKPIAHSFAVSANAIKYMAAVDPIAVGVQPSIITVEYTYRCFDIFFRFRVLLRS